MDRIKEKSKQFDDKNKKRQEKFKENKRKREMNEFLERQEEKEKQQELENKRKEELATARETGEKRAKEQYEKKMKQVEQYEKKLKQVEQHSKQMEKTLKNERKKNEKTNINKLTNVEKFGNIIGKQYDLNNIDNSYDKLTSQVYGKGLHIDLYDNKNETANKLLKPFRIGGLRLANGNYNIYSNDKSLFDGKNKEEKRKITLSDIESD